MMRAIYFFLFFFSIFGVGTAFAFEVKVLGTKGSFLQKKHEFNGFGCNGNNQSPPIRWADAPKETKSFALSIHDPDAPIGAGVWWHWWVVNIDASVMELVEGQFTKNKKFGFQGANSFSPGSRYSYGGPCPPKGETHRYVITIYALDVKNLHVSKDTSPAAIGFQVNHHAIVKAEATVLYRR